MEHSNLGLRVVTGGVSLPAVVLSALAVPAAGSSGLGSNNDAVCLLIGAPLFLLAGIAAGVGLVKGKWWLGLLAFGMAWVIQAWFLTWIEGVGWSQLLRSGANNWLRAWAVLYKWSPVFVAANVMVAVLLQRRWQPRAEA